MKNKVLTIWFTVLLSIILISANPAKAQVDFTWTENCADNPTLFTPTGISIPSIAAWQWDFGDGGMSTVPNALHMYIASGTYTVTLTVIDTSSVTSSVSHPVTIIPPPVAHFSVPIYNCVNNPVIFHNLSHASIGYIVRWTWDFGDGNIHIVNHPANPNVDHTYLVAGTFAATLTVKTSDSCEHTEYQLIDIHPVPSPFFAYNTPSCSNTPVQFIDLSSVQFGYILKWIWNFGDGSPIDTVAFPNDPNVMHQFPSPGIYNVTLTVINSTTSCSNSFSAPVTVNPAPIANFVYSSPVFEDQIVQFTDASSPNGALMIVAWSWNFGDPSSGQLNNTSNLADPQHLYANPGTYIVSQLVTNFNGCVDTIIKPLLISSATSIDFTWVGQCVNYPTQFTPVLNGATITQYNWDFGDGNTSTASNPVHTYSSSGTYNVTFTATDNFGVNTVVTHAVQIYSKPIANFTATQTCFGQPTQFSDLSQAGTGGITQWLWNFGDPASGVLNTSTVQNPVHLFTSAGLFEIQLIVTSSSGCIDTLISPVLIRPLPPVDFIVSNNCVNALVSFTPNAAVMNFGAIASWLWNFGDGNTSILQNPTHVYMASGTYNVTLNVTDTNGCANYATNILTILAIPSASFYYTFPACVQSTISFTDLSQTNGGGAIVSWQWNFGDPASGTANTSNLQNPAHYYAAAGNYNVSLSITNSTGCYSIIMMQITVNGKPTAQFIFTQPALNQPVYFDDLSLPGAGSLVTWNWDFGDGNTSFQQNPVHTYTLPGTYTVGLNVTNEFICSSYADSILVVEPGAGSVTLSGRVLAGSDTLNNASVHLILVDGAGMPVSLLTTSPGLNNEFVFNNIPEGNYYLHATPQYTGPFASAYLPTFYVNSTYWQQASIINLGQAQNPYNIELATYQIINGGTFIINGQIVNAGKSINPADQEVLLLDNQNNPIRWTITDANGYFSFDSLPAGTYGVNPVITGLTTYPYYVVLNGSTSPAFVKMSILGQIITGNKEISKGEQHFKVFPNPANEMLTIEISGLSDSYMVDIFSTSGQLVKTVPLINGSNTMYINTLSRGLYLMKISDKSGNVHTERIIKQ